MIQNLAEIKNAADIVRVVENYIPLRQEGFNFKACCPFHDEKTPSFVVSPAKQIYKCFGCGVSGDAIKFVKEFKRLDFENAVAEVAAIAGVSVEQDNKVAIKRADYYEVLESVNALFMETLNKEQNAKIKQYLINRGLDEAAIKRYNIGLVPESIKVQKQCEALKGGLEKAIELGILGREAQGGRIYASNINRISFALRDANYKLIGFSNRIHPYGEWKNNAKYINSRESVVFKKSQFLYNLHAAKKSILESKECFVVEGFFDVIALNLLGVTNAVASCGTAFNLTHLAQILKLDSNITMTFLFDKDAAGQNALKKSLELLFNHGNFNAKSAEIVGEFKDVGEVLEKGENLKINTKNGFLKYLEILFSDAPTPQAKDKVLESVREMINAQKNYFTKSDLIQTATDFFGCPKDYFLSIIPAREMPALIPSDEAILYKAILSDKDCEELAFEYLVDDAMLGEFAKSYKHYNATQELDDLAASLACDESVPTTPPRELKNLLRSVITKYYTKKLESAKVERDVEKMLLYRKKITALAE